MTPYRSPTLVAPVAPIVLTRWQRFARWFVVFADMETDWKWRRWAGGRWAEVLCQGMGELFVDRHGRHWRQVVRVMECRPVDECPHEKGCCRCEVWP